MGVIGWIVDNVINAIWGFVANLASDIMAKAFSLMTEFIINQSDINKYIDVDVYVKHLQIIAGALITIKVIMKALKFLSGLDEGAKSVGELATRTVYSVFLVFLLPECVKRIFIPINNQIMKLITSIKIEGSSFQKLLFKDDLALGFAELGALMLLLIFILSIGYLILSIAGGIRYMELLLCIVFAPLAAVSAVDNDEGVQIWVRETIAITFTQSLHILLLQILMKVIVVVKGPMMIVLAIGTIAVMLRGPQILRTFLYRSGVGSSTVQAAGAGGRMVAMKCLFNTAKPV